MKRLIYLPIVFAFMLHGCSMFGENTAKQPEEAPSQQQAATKPATEVKPPPAKPEKKEEQKPVVEVIPRNEAKRPDLTLEPLPVEKPPSAEMSQMPEPEQTQQRPS